jgi:hypothetical protein
MRRASARYRFATHWRVSGISERTRDLALERSKLGKAMKMKVAFALSGAAIAASGGGAYDLANRMKSPEGFIEGPRSLFDAEECIVLNVDATFAPVVYRRPDRPDETLIYYANRGSEPVAFGLKRVGAVTKVTIYNGLKWKVPVQRCLDAE